MSIVIEADRDNTITEDHRLVLLMRKNHLLTVMITIAIAEILLEREIITERERGKGIMIADGEKGKSFRGDSGKGHQDQKDRLYLRDLEGLLVHPSLAD